MINRHVAESVARWMGILSTGLIISAEAEAAALRAQKVLGSQQLDELRRWFGALPADALRDAKCAVVEACIAIVHADGKIADAERDFVERMVQLAELDRQTEGWLLERLEQRPTLDAVVPRLAHPALRELVLVMTWQIVAADGSVDAAEDAAHVDLAERLWVDAPRARALRVVLGDER